MSHKEARGLRAGRVVLGESQGDACCMAYEADRAAVGERIRRARTEAGMTNASEFARLIDVQPNSVYRYERGDQLVSSEVLVRIAQVTGRSMEWLMVGESTPTRQALRDWLESPTGRSATPDEIAWLERVDPEGLVPSPVFFDLLLSARRNGLSAPDAVKAAAAFRAAADQT